MLRCTRCDGFVPAELSSCPNCTRHAPRKAGFLSVLGAGAAAITLMACYGGPPCDSSKETCYVPPDAGMTTDAGTEDAGQGDAGTDAGTCDAGNADGGC